MRNFWETGCEAVKSNSQGSQKLFSLFRSPVSLYKIRYIKLESHLPPKRNILIFKPSSPIVVCQCSAVFVTALTKKKSLSWSDWQMFLTVLLSIHLLSSMSIAFLRSFLFIYERLAKLNLRMPVMQVRSFTWINTGLDIFSFFWKLVSLFKLLHHWSFVRFFITVH